MTKDQGVTEDYSNKYYEDEDGKRHNVFDEYRKERGGFGYFRQEFSDITLELRPKRLLFELVPCGAL